jgi:putative FmdB family regulatory protein
MPTYVYACAQCGKRVELYQPYDVEQRIEPTCQECRELMERVWLPVGVHFKGQGWYQTDKHKAAS